MVNIMSDEFKVETADGNKRFTMVWNDHMGKHTKEKVKKMKMKVKIIQKK